MTAAETEKGVEPSQDDYALVAKAAAEVEAPDLPYRPPMPRDRTAPIALVGAGGISAAHLDAYARHGLNVVAICSRDLERARARGATPISRMRASPTISIPCCAIRT